MGMTIDDAILQLEECKAYRQCDTEKDMNAFDVAIDTMRKYQKIEEIMHIEMNGKEALQEIERILRE